MRVKGRVVKWQNDKGFGFIEPLRGNRDVFFHENFLLNPSRRPVVGDEVSYNIYTSSDGKQRADRVLLRGDVDPRRRDGIFDLFYWVVSFLFLACVGVLGFIKILDPVFLILYLFLSIITFLLYWRDKVKAQKDEWRIPENKLHLFSLLGGWPGALIAQRLFHHKSRKKSFKIVFGLTVMINIIGVSFYCISALKFIQYDSIVKKINMKIAGVVTENSHESSIQRNSGPIYSWENNKGQIIFSNVGFPQNEPYRNGKIEWK